MDEGYHKKGIEYLLRQMYRDLQYRYETIPYDVLANTWFFYKDHPEQVDIDLRDLEKQGRIIKHPDGTYSLSPEEKNRIKEIENNKPPFSLLETSIVMGFIEKPGSASFEYLQECKIPSFSKLDRLSQCLKYLIENGKIIQNADKTYSISPEKENFSRPSDSFAPPSDSFKPHTDWAPEKDTVWEDDTRLSPPGLPGPF